MWRLVGKRHTNKKVLDSLRTMGFEEYVVECMKTRWETEDRIIEGTSDIILHTPVTTWAVATIEGIDKSWSLQITSYSFSHPTRFGPQENKNSRFRLLKSFTLRRRRTHTKRDHALLQ
jgi:hypothetical protein